VAPERLKVFAGETPEVRTDSGLLGIVINNLLDNALKYSSAQSHVDIRLETGSDGIRLSVSNTVSAAGWPDEQRLFSKYYRAPAAQAKSGSGLGLYLSRQLVQLLGGSLQYRPLSGRVEFVLCLPV
jgi:signal transduction histidine kinase